MTVDRPDLSIDKLALGSFWVSKCVCGECGGWVECRSIECLLSMWFVFVTFVLVSMVNCESVLVSVLASLVVSFTAWCWVDV